MTYPGDWKGCAVITKELCPEPGMGGVAEAARDAEALTERTVWKTRFWDTLQGEDVTGQKNQHTADYWTRSYQKDSPGA